MQVLIDERVNSVIEKYFTDLGYNVIKINKNLNLYSEISSHTDILCFKLGNNIFCSSNLKHIDCFNNYSVTYEEILENTQYNICLIDNFAIHNFEKTSKKVLKKLKELGYTLINVGQGYARCSILPLKNKSCITCDKGIYKELIKYKFDVLLINEKLDIKLFNDNKSYSDMNGFIGGCSCTLDDNVIFFGDINKFKDKDRIIKYIMDKGYNITYFKELEMIDYGSCIFID